MERESLAQGARPIRRSKPRRARHGANKQIRAILLGPAGKDLAAEPKPRVRADRIELADRRKSE